MMGGLGATLIWVMWVGTASGYYNPGSQPQEHGEVYCECVPYYLCVDGVIITDGRNVIDVRTASSRNRVTNVEECPSYIDICCGIPPSPTPFSSSSTITTSSSSIPPPTLLPSLPPDTPCRCVPFLECPPELLVSDGRGNITLEFLGLSYSHSQCLDAFSLCCAIDSMPTPTPTPAPTSTTPQCECVEPYLCDQDGYINVDGHGLQDLRKVTQSVTRLASGECSNTNFVCCLLPPPFHTSSSATTTTTSTTTDFIISTNVTSALSSLFNVSTEAPTTTTTTATQESPGSCGIRNSNGIVVRITGFLDGESQFGEFPWVAAVLNSAPVMGVPAYRFVGGGTLIHPRVVLTAAHKLTNVNTSYLAVRLGEWDTQKEQEPHRHQNIAVERIVIHPRFYAPALFYDVALLFLQEEAVLAPHVNTLCMAENLDDIDTSTCVINGWGVDSFDMGKYQEVMKSLTLPLVDRPTCVDSLRNTRLGRYFRLHPTFLCAGGEEGKDACKGDGGGPLACPVKDGEPGKYLLVGITAWGIGCGENGVPGVYVNVPFLYHWITDTMRFHLPDTPTTTTATSTTTTTAVPTTTRLYRSRLFW